MGVSKEARGGRNAAAEGVVAILTCNSSRSDGPGRWREGGREGYGLVGARPTEMRRSPDLN